MFSEPSAPDGSAEGPAIALQAVTKLYTGDAAAVDAIDLEIGEREFFSMLGPSGCGKTTTLRMIGGFEQASSGRILLHGRDVTHVPPNRRDVNLVFQSYALFPHLDVAANVAFGLRRNGVARSEIKRRVGEALELVELAGKARRRPKELSGGQQQRVALARALVNRPRALLLDEPLAALDLKLRQTMQTELKRIQREVGITFVYVTHDQGEALALSDRIAVMHRGRIEQLGDPATLYERPSSRFVAGFIGTSNLLPVRVDRIVDGHALGRCGGEESVVVVLPEQLAATAPGRLLEVSIRPEKITLTDAPPPTLCRLRGTVVGTEYLGTATSFTVVTADGSRLLVFRQNGREHSEIPRVGDQAWLSWEPVHGTAFAADDPGVEVHGS